MGEVGGSGRKFRSDLDEEDNRSLYSWACFIPINWA